MAGSIKRLTKGYQGLYMCC